MTLPLLKKPHLLFNFAFKRSWNGEIDLLKRLVSLDLITCLKYLESSGMESKPLLSQMLSEERLRECWRKRGNIKHYRMVLRELKVHQAWEAWPWLEVKKLVLRALMHKVLTLLTTVRSKMVTMKMTMMIWESRMIQLVTEISSRPSMKSSRKSLTKSWMMLTPDLSISRN
jgi:hypothetical protein